MKHFDILIIGNGILGTSIAFELTSRDKNLNLAIVGPQQKPGAATIAAGAMLGCFGEVTKTSFKTKHHIDKFNLCHGASTLWDPWLSSIEQCSNDTIPLSEGCFIIRNTQSGVIDDHNYIAIQEALEAYDCEYSICRTSDIPGYHPISTQRAYDSLFIPSEKSLNPNQLLSALNKTLVNANCEFVYHTVIDIKHTEAKTIVTLSNGEKISASNIVISAGSQSQPLIDALGLQKNIPNLFSGVGSAFVAQAENLAIKHIIRTPNRSFACGLHVLPQANNQLYVGATNNVSLFPEHHPRLSLINFVTQCFVEQINQDLHNAKIIKLLTGNRPVSLDTFPLIGKTHKKGVYIASGTYRDGIHQSPSIAKYLADVIFDAGEKEGSLYKAFTPERKLIPTYKHKNEAIGDAVEAYMSGAYEHKLYMPRVGWDKFFEELIRERLNKIYDKLSSKYIISPDFLLMIDEGNEQQVIDILNKCIEEKEGV